MYRLDPEQFPVRAWLAHCRAGFESTAAAELTRHAADAGLMAVYAIAREGEGYLRLLHADPQSDRRMTDEAPARTIFCRQVIRELAWLEGLPGDDRVTPILDALPDGAGFNDLQISVPDTNSGKELGRFVRGFRRALTAGLSQRGMPLDVLQAPRLHLMFPDSGRVSIGLDTDPAAPAGGVRRLRMPGAAPSRSTLKLDEAIQSLLTPAERERLFQPGMTAVDLGASPGGWTWQMVRRHIHVHAIDNGPMDPGLLDSGLVTHVRADGFAWQPERPVDWLLCDIVDKPSRVADRMAVWLERGWARHAVFNLKLPMKRIWPFVEDLLAKLATRTDDLPGHPELRVRQLYHDRNEITVCLIRQ